MSPSAVRPRISGRLLRGSLVPMALLVGWILLSRDRSYAYAFVPIGQIGRGWLEITASGDLPRGLLASLTKAVVALCLGGPAGILLGASMAGSRWVDRTIGPLLHAVRQVPYLGLAPLIGLWFGSGDLAKVLLVFLAVLYPMVLSTYEGVRNVEPRLLEVARVLRLDAGQVFFKVTLPSTLPYIYTGLSQSIAFAWIATVGSEMLMHSGMGIGTLMQSAVAGGRTELVLVCVLSVAMASLGIEWLLSRFGQRALRWRVGA